MTCTKCGGLVINDCGDVRCLNCGKRVTDPVREADPVPVKEVVTVGAAWTPERRAKFEATIAAKQAERDGNPGKPKKVPGGGAVTTMPAKRSQPVRVLPPAGSDAVRGIDEMIAKLQDDLAALERAKDVLTRL